MAGCNPDWFDSVSAFHDGEVTREDGLRIEEHLRSCAACGRAFALLGELRGSLVAQAEREVPDRVRERAEAVVYRRAIGKERWIAKAALASSLVAAAAAASLLLRPAEKLAPSLQHELVSHHWNGFTRERPCDFESSDPAAVGSWLEEKLGYPVSVSVPRGATLMGARLCRITEQPTAAVMFRTEEKNALTVFVPPPSSRAASMARSFVDGGVRCTSGPLGAAICIRNEGQPMLAVADLHPDALEQALAPTSF